MSRSFILSLILIGYFVIMVVMLVLGNAPNLQFVVASIILLLFLIFIALKVRRSDKKIENKKENIDYLPPLLKQSRFLQILFGSVALSIILSIMALPIFLLFFTWRDCFH